MKTGKEPSLKTLHLMPLKKNSEKGNIFERDRDNLTHLHVHSWYSFLEGTGSPEILIAKAKEYNMKSLALTDTNGMYGLISFAKKAAAAGIKPLLGVYLNDPSGKSGAGFDNVDPAFYALLLARNRDGYSELCKITTARKLRTDFSIILFLQDYHKDLFIITPSVQLLEQIPHYDNIYAELVGDAPFTRNLYDYACGKKIKYVFSYPVYFPEKEDYLMHRVVTAIRTRGTIENLTLKEMANEECYFKDVSRLIYKWEKMPLAIQNVSYIVDNCNVDLGLGKYKFPLFALPEGETSYSYLWKLSRRGLEQRYEPLTSACSNRLQYELDVISELSLSDYFLIVWDIVSEAKRRGMMLIGRGSAANSIVSYCLGCTEVDPIKYNFYFERFLNRGRTSPPDIDLDFSWKERDQIVRYVFEKYGYEKVAMISTHVTFKARSAFRETAKTFGFSDREISSMSKFIPWTDARNLPHVAQLFPEARSLKLNEEPWSTITTIASCLANAPRHMSIHPSGIVVTPEPVTNYCALEFANNKGLGLIITQPDMYSIEDMGLIKIDLLSQRSLGVLRDTLKLIEDNFIEQNNVMKSNPLSEDKNTSLESQNSSYRIKSNHLSGDKVAITKGKTGS